MVTGTSSGCVCEVPLSYTMDVVVAAIVQLFFVVVYRRSPYFIRMFLCGTHLYNQVHELCDIRYVGAQIIGADQVTNISRISKYEVVIILDIGCFGGSPDMPIKTYVCLRQ